MRDIKPDEPLERSGRLASLEIAGFSSLASLASENERCQLIDWFGVWAGLFSLGQGHCGSKLPQELSRTQ
jgi:hypothetical protein